MRALRSVLVVAILSLGVAAPALAGPTVTEFPAGLGPWGLAKAADGAVWFTDVPNPGAVSRLSSSGVTVTTLAGGTPGFSKDAQPKAIAGASSGVWFTENGKNKVGRVAADGTITEFAGGNHDHPTGITAGPDGNVWFVATGKHGGVLRMTSAGAITEWSTPTQDGNPQDIALGPDGNLWFTEPAKKRIGRITPLGTITEFDGTAVLGGGAPQQIVAGPDGNLWFTIGGTAPGIGRISTQGAFSPPFRTGLLLNAAPADIAAGADGNLYFTDPGANAIGHITPSGTITEQTAGITAAAGLQGIESGGDGRIWFAENGKAQVGRLSVAPSAGVVSATGITDDQAELSAVVSPNSEATTVHFEWGTTSGVYDHVMPDSAPITGPAEQTVTATVTGLGASHAIYARVVATNATGTTSGPETAFTTTDLGAPSATTLAPTEVDASSARLNASVNPESLATTYRFEWGTEIGSWTGSVPVPDGSLSAGTATLPVESQLTGLAPNTTYRYRVVATSSKGTTYGGVETFTTDAVAPAATTSPATGVTAADATLAGFVDPRHSATTYHFEWGTTDAYGSSVPLADELVGDDQAPHAVEQALSGLAPSTTYHFRVVATNAAAVAVGEDHAFTTAGVPPLAATAAADAITTTSARLHASVDPRNDAAATYRFEWGPTTAYGQALVDAPIPGQPDQGSREVSADITGLQPGTLYHFRVVATSAAGETPGQDAWLTTATPPTTTDATSTTPTGTTTTTTTTEPGAPTPELGRSAVADVASGSVRIRVPGSAKAVPLADVRSIPTGSTIDARNGTLELETALDRAGHRQTAQFRGAVFKIALAKTGGMVDLKLTERATGCATRSTRAQPRAAASRKRKRQPSLWGKDSRGKYRTHGRNSVATVRGTEWVTTETCTGTLTRVVRGAVSVRDLRTKRTRLVRAGHRYLARARP